MNERYIELVEAARAAMEKAYCPYSKFRVGAAVLTAGGKIYTGANVENASYGLSCCAERVAIHKAVSEGERQIRAIAVMLDAKSFAAPCGACRQVIYEFGRDADVIMAKPDGSTVVKPIGELLSLPFGPESL